MLLICPAALAGGDVFIRQNSFQSDCPIIRAQRAFKFQAVIEDPSNSGYECRLTLPNDGSKQANENSTLVSTGIYRHTWDVVCGAAGMSDFVLEVLVDGEVVSRSAISQTVMPFRKIEKLSYMPEPKPVKTDILVGAHHCPIWDRGRKGSWDAVMNVHQERTPALGLYMQDHAEVADWETKWAVEHGVSFFIYCWYRASQGGPVTTKYEKSMFDDGLFKSKYADRMKFTIMWENQHKGHGGVSDEKDLLENLLPYWIEKFFKLENYLKIDNKPVLFVYQPDAVARDLGGNASVKAAFGKMREACKKAGFGGLIIMGEYRGTDIERIRAFKEMGLDASFAYCWHVDSSPSPLVAANRQMEKIKKTQEWKDVLPQVVTLSQGWSGWHDEGSIWKLPPAEFEALLRRGKNFIRENFTADDLGGKMVILDNWNEWGEGHYIAPYREYGFGYLDAVRRVFSSAPEEHEDIIPEDIGQDLKQFK